jgi:hypothetical protein
MQTDSVVAVGVGVVAQRKTANYLPVARMVTTEEVAMNGRLP